MDVYFGRHPQEARQAPTAGADSAGRVAAMGASTVLDYHEPDWPERVRVLTGGGADAAANAVRAGSLGALRDGGRLATITADLPAAERDITMRAVQVAADGRRLGRLVQLFAQGLLAVSVDDRFPLERAGAALAGAGTVPTAQPPCCGPALRGEDHGRTAVTD